MLTENKLLIGVGAALAAPVYKFLDDAKAKS